MFILTIEGKEEEGAYSVTNEYDEQVLYIFQQEDDAVRFAMMLEENEYPSMHVIEVDEDLIIKACESHNYQYAIITENDIVIPPENMENYDFI
jgi:hypothetical protein